MREQRGGATGGCGEVRARPGAIRMIPWRRLRTGLVAVAVTAAVVAVPATGRAHDTVLDSRPVAQTEVPPAGGGAVVAAVGDLVCGPGSRTSASECRQRQVSDLVVEDPAVAALLALGDLQYNNGQLANFQRFYEPSYGRVKAITRPVPGNHEYRTPGAAGYFGYFGAAAGDPAEGWYSFDLGDWHLVALNSNCEQVSCAAGSAQAQWLRADLATTSHRCVLAYWHQPRWASGIAPGDSPEVAPFWRLLQQHRAEVVLAGHAHNYERFAPQRPDGTAAANGIRQFVVGTGGRSVGPRYGFNAPRPNSQMRIAHVFGLLRLTLSANAYRWAFVDERGRVRDSGTSSCH